MNHKELQAECAPKLLIYSKFQWTLVLELYKKEQNSSVINGVNKQYNNAKKN